MFSDDTYGSSSRGGTIHWGPVLIGLGVAFLLLRILVPTGALPLLFLGGIFTAVSFGRGMRGFLIPGGILLGLGTGVVAAALLSHLSGALGGAAVVGGLSAGFWGIHLIERMRNPYGSGFAWARIPGTILLALAGMLAFLGTISVGFRVAAVLLHWWPLLLIAGGLMVVFTARRRSRSY